MDGDLIQLQAKRLLIETENPNTNQKIIEKKWMFNCEILYKLSVIKK